MWMNKWLLTIFNIDMQAGRQAGKNIVFVWE